MTTVALKEKVANASPYLVSVQSVASSPERALASFAVGDLSVDVKLGPDSVWALIRRRGQGGVALRAAYLGGAGSARRLLRQEGEALRLKVTSALGDHIIVFRGGMDGLEHMRMTVDFIAATDTVIPFMPRDLYPLDAGNDPLRAVGHVEASQRGLNSGLLYFRVDEPEFGHVLYFQNFTALNDYFHATGTTPNESVGGHWPELGFLLPTPPQSGIPHARVLNAGKRLTISDAILVFRHRAPKDERGSACQFLQMLGIAYKALDLPAVEYRDWITRAENTLRDLDEAPEATIRHYGFRYVHPYTAAEYPDIMVQMSIISAIHDWAKWTGEPQPLEAEFKAGLRKFYDRKLGTLRRYLPNVGKDKDADAVDSWYLYHPLLNLGKLALDGDSAARELFLTSIDYGIRSAHHFGYKWPVQYKVDDFSIITDVAEADGRGQTDVGGIYAWVMLQAFELTDDKRYLDEARAAIDAAVGLRFDINYQANLTAWGAAACMRLWRITNRDIYLEQSYVYLASFFHHCEIWQSRIGLAVHYKNFLGATCLQDAPYMAIYECFDSFAALECYLNDSGPELEPSARMLISEYCKYALDRAWYYYPDALPPEVISPKQREANGHVDPRLSFPLEDLYPDGQQAGQVGQEIYGAGAAFVFASRSFHNVDQAPFRLYCNHLVRSFERTGDRTLSITLDGGETCVAHLAFVRLKRRKLGRVVVATAGGDVLRPAHSRPERIDYRVPASGRLTISWE